jgi:hypothetical protein
VAYVREKTVYEGGREYRYYQLVKAKREGGKVKQEFLHYLGKYPAKAAAQKAAAEWLEAHPEHATKRATRKPDYLRRLRDLSATYEDSERRMREGIREFNTTGKGWNMHVFVMNDLRKKRSSAARSKLEAMEAEVAHIIEAEERMQAARDEAVALYDSLSAEEQQRVQDEKLWVIKYELERRNSPFRTGLL